MPDIDDHATVLFMEDEHTAALQPVACKKLCVPLLCRTHAAVDGGERDVELDPGGSDHDS